MDSHSSKSIGLSYTLGFGKDEENKVVVLPNNGVYSDGKVDFNYVMNYNILKRSKHAQQLYGRKKVTFTLILNRGFWKGSEVLGMMMMVIMMMMMMALMMMMMMMIMMIIIVTIMMIILLSQVKLSFHSVIS